MIVPHVPVELEPLLLALAPAFTTPTFRRFVTLLVAAIVTPGRRTVANLLRTVGGRLCGHRTSYQRVLSNAHWSALQVACLLSRFVVRHVLPTGVITLVGDDTVDGHKGKNVYGKARHRDPVRSTHSYTAFRYGHKWVVLAVLVRFSFARRPWALPLLIDLYYSAQDNQRRHRPHRTPPQIMRRLLRVLLRWFPERCFVFVGDGGYGTHELARFCQTHQPRLSLISKFHPKANLYRPPPRYCGHGRPRVKGEALPKPCEVVAQRQRLRRLKVDWYGGSRRQVAVVTGAGQWYKSGAGLVGVRWVFVQDRSGTHREEYFFTTDPRLTPSAIIGYYTSRWNIETTFEEMRSYLGLETTRGWCERTVLRAAPCLFGLYTVVAVLYQSLPKAKRGGSIQWPGKSGVTFSDALHAVRRWLWADYLFAQADPKGHLQKLDPQLRQLILSSLAPAA